MKSRSIGLTIVLSLVLSLLFAIQPVPAQELTTGTLTGRVTDPTGRPIPEAVIIVVSAAGTRSASTDANGQYIVPFLRPGTCSVRVEAGGGFTTPTPSAIALGLNHRGTMKFAPAPEANRTRSGDP